jgi:hypothetical protein
VSEFDKCKKVRYVVCQKGGGVVEKLRIIYSGEKERWLDVEICDKTLTVSANHFRYIRSGDKKLIVTFIDGIKQLEIDNEC